MARPERGKVQSRKSWRGNYVFVMSIAVLFTRAVAYKVWESKIDIENEDRVSQVFRNNDIEQEFSGGFVEDPL